MSVLLLLALARPMELTDTVTSAKIQLAASPHQNTKGKEDGPGKVRQDVESPKGDELIKPEVFVAKTPLPLDSAKKLEAKKLYVIALGQIEKNQLHLALGTLQKAFEQDPRSVAVIRQLALLHIQLERPTEGMKFVEKALELTPDDAELLLALGQLQGEMGKPEAALKTFEKMSKVEKLLDTDRNRYLAVRQEIANFANRLGKFEKEVTAIEEILAVLDPLAAKADSDNDARKLSSLRPRFYERLGRAYRNVKQPDKAIELLSRGITIEPGGNRLGYQLAEALADKQLYQKALDTLKDYLRSNQPQDPGPMSLFESLYKKLGKPDAELISDLEKFMEKDPFNPRLRLLLGMKQLDLKQYDKAKENLERLKERPEAKVALIRLFRETNNPKEFYETLKRENLRTPQEEQQLEKLVESLAQDLAFLKSVAALARDRKGDSNIIPTVIIARSAAKAKDIELSKEFYLMAIKEMPNNVALDEELLDVFSKNERYQDMVDHCREALKNRPGEFGLVDNLARSLEALGKTDDALSTIKDFLKRDLEKEYRFSANLTLGWIYQHAKKWDEGAQVYKQILNENPKGREAAFARYLLAGLYSTKGDSKLAEKELTVLLENDFETLGPRIQAAVNNDLGYLWADEGKNLDKAEAMIRKAVALQPQNGAYLDSLGWVLFKTKRFEESVKYLKQAVTAEDGKDPVIWDHLGEAQLQLGDKTEAKKSWEKAVEAYKKELRGNDPEKRKQVEQKLKLLDERSADANKK